MRAQRGVRKVCTRGHVFYKSSDCPVCPICWAGYYAKNGAKGDLPKLSAPAVRALMRAKITTLTKLARFSEKDILALHGIGPSAIPILRSALRKQKLSFKKAT